MSRILSVHHHGCDSGEFRVSIRNIFFVFIALTLMVSCGGGGGSSSPQSPVVTQPPEPDPTGLWVRSDNDGEGLASYSAKLTQIAATRSATGGVVLEAAPAADAASGGFSSTYTWKQMSMSTTLLNTTVRLWQLPRLEVAAVLLRSP